MNGAAYQTLEEVVLDECFPEADLALRRGRHIGRDDGASYDFLVEAIDHLEPLYRRFGCELVHQSDGYFYLLPSGDRMGRRQLSAGEMLVGQTLALMYLDPSTLRHGGVVARGDLLQQLGGLVGTDSLFRTLNPRRRKFDERVAAEALRGQVGEALRRLAELGFLDLLEDDAVRMRPALLRFAEPVRGLQDQATALARLVARGELSLAEPGDTQELAPDEEEQAP